MTAVFVGIGCSCAVFGVIVASLIIGILVGVCRLKKFKARKKRCVCVHTNVMYHVMDRCMCRLLKVSCAFVCVPLCDILLLLYGLCIIYYYMILYCDKLIVETFYVSKGQVLLFNCH